MEDTLAEKMNPKVSNRAASNAVGTKEETLIARERYIA